MIPSTSLGEQMLTLIVMIMKDPDLDLDQQWERV